MKSFSSATNFFDAQKACYNKKAAALGDGQQPVPSRKRRGAWMMDAVTSCLTANDCQPDVADGKVVHHMMETAHHVCHKGQQKPMPEGGATGGGPQGRWHHHEDLCRCLSATQPELNIQCPQGKRSSSSSSSS